VLFDLDFGYVLGGCGVAFLFGVSEEQLGTHANGNKGQIRIPDWGRSEVNLIN
jgi:hypothetical protein